MFGYVTFLIFNYNICITVYKYNIIMDSDEEILEFIVDNIKPRKAYKVQERINHMEKWNDEEFFIRFRLMKHTILMLLEMIEEQLTFKTDR